MNRERWQRIETIYLGALEAPDRAAFLAGACLDDGELRRDVESLLACDPHTTVLLNRLAPPAGGRQHRRRSQLDPESAFGRYRIVNRLGAGGSSDVYRAFDPSLNRDVALKVFTDGALTPEFRERFLLEARAAASLNDPNIATIYEAGDVEGSYYIAMEYIDGGTFREVLHDDGRTMHERLACLAHVGHALARAHARGIVHCDLKPENVMRTTEGIIKILDFGLARLVRGYRRDDPDPSSRADDTRAGVEGTVGYMSPEQALGHTLDARSDVFSFGCMLFEVVARTTPFVDESVVRSLHRLVYDGPMAPVPADAPAGLRALVDGCLEKDPARRWPSMEDVARQLDAVVTPRPSRWRAGLVAAALIVAAGGGVWWILGGRVDPEAYEQLVRGRFEMWRFTPDSSENAIANFKTALAKDPKLAEAAAELANTYRRAGLAGIRHPDEALRDAEAAARRAIALDDDLAQAHTVLADIKRDQWQWTESMNKYLDTVTRFPAYIPARIGYAIGLSVIGDKAGATAQLLRARELGISQGSAGNSSVVDLAAVYYNMREFDKALVMLDPPGNKDTYASALNAWKGIVYGGSGRPDEAVKSHALARTLGEKTMGMTCYYINVLARANQRDEALRLLREVETTKEYVPPSELAIAYVGLGDHERALDELEKALEKHDPLLQYIVVEWNLDPIRHHARFRRVVTDMGLTP